MVAAGFVVLFVVYGLQFSYGEFRLAATEEEGWSQATLSAIFAVYIAAYGALSMVSGWATDRFGPRLTVGIGSILLCAGYGLWAASPNLLMVTLALAVIAPIGMSCSWVPVNATVVRWFVRRRGSAGAIVTSGGSVGNIVGPPVAAGLIAAWGWRTGLAVMAGVGLVLLLLAASVLVRGPESVGLLPDGDHPTAATVAPAGPAAAGHALTGDGLTGDTGGADAGAVIAGDAPAGDADGVTPAEAVRTGTFWLLWAMYSLTFTVVFVPFVHGSAYAVDLGVSKLGAATVISAIGVGGLTGRLIVGAVSDRIDRRRAVTGALLAQMAGFVGLASASDLGVLYPAAVSFGFGYGGSVAVFPALIGDYFGRTHAGAIVGRMFASAASVAAVGPYVAALIFEASGSYRSAFLVSAGLNGAAFVLATRLPPTGVAGSRPG